MPITNVKYGQFILLYQWAAIFPCLVFDRPWHKAMKKKALLAESADSPSNDAPEGESIIEPSTSADAPIPFEGLNPDPYYGFPFWQKLYYEILVPPVDQPVAFIAYLLAFGILVHSFYCLSEYNKRFEEEDVSSEPTIEASQEPSYEMPSFIEESIHLDSYLNPVFFDSIAQVFY